MRKILPILFIPFALGLWFGGTASAAPVHNGCRAVLAVAGFRAVSCEDLLTMQNQQCADTYREGSPEMARCRSRAMQDYEDFLRDQRHCSGNLGSMLGC